MAIDKAIDSVKLESDLSSIADAIREKGGTSEQLAFPAGFVSAIGAISAGGGVASGVYIPSEDLTITSKIRIPHNLGRIPTHCIQLLKEESEISPSASRMPCIYIDNEILFAYQCPGSGTTVKAKVATNQRDTFENRHTPTETDFSLMGAYTSTYSIKRYIGEPIYWFVW